ncbi:MAG TPA: CGNR zinc finger domain-containing protein [Candidatus Methylomirabilis sp.]|nr:CGNR zinc finger domain-containing protein [Candidatus Methylomirabilis sp.]
MSPSLSDPLLVGGRLAIDFCNAPSPRGRFTWEELLHFLLTTRIISAERSGELLALPEADSQTAGALLSKAQRLQVALQAAFAAIVARESVSRASVEPINQILGITEGHDELVQEGGKWRLEFVAHEGGLDWLLAAIARSAAEIIAEGASARLRICANPSCGLFFYDTSRTKKRRWCSMARCGNRHKVAAFSRRHSAAKRPS